MSIGHAASPLWLSPKREGQEVETLFAFYVMLMTGSSIGLPLAFTLASTLPGGWWCLMNMQHRLSDGVQSERAVHQFEAANQLPDF